jgi:RimJ/RimL family protein N-acetyltransferase
MPAGIRCTAVLEGIMPGKIFTDDPRNPTWAILQETVFHTIYVGGAVTAPIVAEVITKLRNENEVFFGFWQNDEVVKLLPSDAYYYGFVFDYTNRSTEIDLSYFLAVPEGYEVKPMDLELFRRTSDYELNLSIYGSAEKALEAGIGYCVLHNYKIVAEAFAAPLVHGVIEIGVNTVKEQQNRGLATVVCAYTIKKCEALGYQTYWNCNITNLPSVALAKKLGYQTEREYRLLAWAKIEPK